MVKVDWRDDVIARGGGFDCGLSIFAKSLVKRRRRRGSM